VSCLFVRLCLVDYWDQEEALGKSKVLTPVVGLDCWADTPVKANAVTAAMVEMDRILTGISVLTCRIEKMSTC